MNDTIKKIVKTAKSKIDACGCTTVDRVAKHYYDMLTDIDEEDAANEVYKYYEKMWS